ncbi:hypothetical protein [Rossellomorea sp. YZS02]|uniref:hypothetical protein n=1 Tax=Rossellomorea sp. YZS02 TaxID=3097358 RepID=UPI002A0C53A9|nr:hypothetical protein [Rossellomorea sp. YZS02]MDX8343100.1 hypothetical protein [Rossellomorea sp. YZS02]
MIRLKRIISGGQVISVKEEGSLFVGLYWGVVFSIPLWISIFGWIKMWQRVMG